MRDTECVVEAFETGLRDRLRQLGSDARRSNQGSAKRIVPSATCVAPHATNSSTSRPSARHPFHDRQPGRTAAGVHRCERNRLQRGTGVATRAARECWTQLPVECDAANRVHEREAVGAGGLDRARHLADIPGSGGKLGVKRQRGESAAGGDDLGCRLSGASSTFGHERFSSMAATSPRPSCSHVSAYSRAENPPTETQIGMSNALANAAAFG